MEQDQQVNEIAVVSGDDWIGIYVNGSLCCEGHGGRQHADVLQLGAENQPFSVRSMFCDVEWLVLNGSFPQRLSDVTIESEVTPNSDLAAQ